jgi:hypothetical protein
LRAAAAAAGSPDPQDVRSVVEEFVHRTLKEINVFPRQAATLGGRYYECSWIGAGDGDLVRSRSGVSRWSGRHRQFIPLVTDAEGRQLLQIKFDHKSGGWWTAVIGFGLLADAGWAVIPVERHRRLQLEIKNAGGTTPFPVRVRLEDATQTGSGGSFHQSTSESRSWTNATDYFQRFDVALPADFDWDTSAYPFNTSDVDRQKILQLSIGRGPTDPPCAGTLEIRRILFLPT